MSLELCRTPEERFAALPAYPFAPHHVEVDGVRIHHLDEGPPGAAPVLLLHGEPSWSFLYRRAVPIIAAAGHRVVAPTWSASAAPTSRCVARSTPISATWTGCAAWSSSWSCVTSPSCVTTGAV